MGTKDQLLDRIIDHVSRGKCILYAADSRAAACSHLSDELRSESIEDNDIRTHSSIDNLHGAADAIAGVQLGKRARKEDMLDLVVNELDSEGAERVAETSVVHRVANFSCTLRVCIGF